MEKLETPTTIEQAIERAPKFGYMYMLECSPKCNGINDTWLFRNGEIKGPKSSAPNDVSNEQWINRWMDKLYTRLCITPFEPDTYYRFTAKKEEYQNAKLDEFLPSRIHRNCENGAHDNCPPEKGKSVASGPFLTYFKDHPHSFLLRGDLVKERCSDGAPLLEVNANLKLASDLMSISELLTKFYEHNQSRFESVTRNSGVSEVDLFNLSLGIWDNYSPGN